MNTPRIFAQITKVDVAKREVWGRATDESIDKADEAFDYLKSKPYFEDWSKSFADATDGKSLGNIRSMHGKIAAGKVIKIDFNDTAKAIDIGAKIVDNNEWEKVMEGVHTGFSIAGSYVGAPVVEKVGDKEIRRYVANPSEISLVDSPCNPNARFFDIVKADGTTEKVDFKPAPIEVKGNDGDVATFGQAMNAGGITLAKAIELVNIEAMHTTIDDLTKREFSTEERDARAKNGHALPDGSFPIDNKSDLSNAIHAYGRAKDKAKAKAHIIARAKALGASDMIPEDWGKAEPPGDVVKVVDPLEAAIAEGNKLGGLRKRLADPELPFAEFVKIAQEHLSDDELKALKGGDTKSIVDAVLAKAGKMSAANMDRLQAAHDHLVAMGADCAGDDADKATPNGELAKVVDTMDKEMKALRAEVVKLKAQPMPHPIQLRAIKKEETSPIKAAAMSDPTAPPAVETVEKFNGKPYTWFVKFPDGRVDWAASEDKLAQELGAAA